MPVVKVSSKFDLLPLRTMWKHSEFSDLVLGQSQIFIVNEEH